MWNQRKIRSLWFVFGMLLASPAYTAPQHGISMHGDLKYKPQQPFSYVNPQAPKGGTLKLGIVGTFDSTNPYITKGKTPPGLSLFFERLVFESLLKPSADEPFSMYGLVAERVEMAPDRSWIVFYLNPKAQWPDGKPITADDVLFSYETLRAKGRPNLRLFYSQVDKAEKIDERTIKFTFKPLEGQKDYNPESPFLIGLMAVLPKHFFGGRDFEKVSLEKVMGSGPYRIKEMKPGHSITYERRPDYWGKDLAVNQGQYNFDEIKYDYFRDAKVAFEGFKTGLYDFRGESDPLAWFTAYDFPAVTKGKVVKMEVTHQLPVGVFSIVFNTRRPLFQDRRVREALNYTFDFEWMNKTYSHGAFVRTRSFFDNTELASRGLPEGRELALLEPFRKQLPEEVFTKEYRPPLTNGSGQIRENLRKARHLLEQAGWKTQKGVLVHEKTGESFSFELLIHGPEEEKVALAWAQNLKQLGIQIRIYTAEPLQFQNRRLQLDYDTLMQTYWGGTRSPGLEQTFYFSSAQADGEGSRNYPGIKDPVVDVLVQKVAQARNREELLASVRALDRVLLWGHYIIPLFHLNKFYLAYYKDRLDHPAFDPHVAPQLSFWWSKEAEKNKK